MRKMLRHIIYVLINDFMLFVEKSVKKKISMNSFQPIKSPCFKALPLSDLFILSWLYVCLIFLSVASLSLKDQDLTYLFLVHHLLFWYIHFYILSIHPPHLHTIYLYYLSTMLWKKPIPFKLIQGERIFNWYLKQALWQPPSG